jgi:hypothetical protein
MNELFGHHYIRTTGSSANTARDVGARWGLGDVRKSRPLNAPPARGMPPEVLVGTAGRAARRQHTQASWMYM